MSLDQQNPRLKKLLECLEDFTMLEFKKDICLTCVYRTMEEQEALYAPNTAPASPHMNYEAADIRSTDFSATEISRMLVFLNQFTFRNGKPVALYHMLPGNAWHFHTQMAKS